MNATNSTAITIWPGQPWTVMARLVTAAGAAIATSAVTGIRLQIFDRSETAIVIGGSAVTGIAIATSSVTNSLANTGGWSEAEGFNFSYTYDPASFLSGGQSYREEIRLTGTFGVLFVVVKISVLPTGQDPS